MKHEVLLLANSKKNAGRCLAGLRISDGKWVRPVSDKSGGPIPNERCVVNGRALRPLDVVVLDLIEHAPRAHQAEDWVLRDERIEVMEPANSNVVAELLEMAASTPADFVSSATEHILAEDVERIGHPMDSLALLRTDALKIDRSFGNTPRALFATENQMWSPRYTDDIWPELALGESVQLGAAYVCMSLAEAFSPYGTAALRHYKLAAGMVQLVS